MRLIEYLSAEFKKETGIDLHKDPLACSAWKEAAGEKPRSSCPARSRPRSTCRTSPPTPPGP